MEKEQLQELYERYKESTRLSPRHSMRAFWNDYIAHSLAFAIGVEDSPPSEETYGRLSDYYNESRLVASQQLVDAFITHTATFIVAHSEGEEDEATGLSLDELGVAAEVTGKLSRRGITSIMDIYTNEIDLTDRQFGMLTEALVAAVKRAGDDSEVTEEEPAPEAPVEDAEGEGEPNEDESVEDESDEDESDTEEPVEAPSEEENEE